MKGEWPPLGNSLKSTEKKKISAFLEREWKNSPGACMGPNLFLPLKSCSYSHTKSYSGRAIPQELFLKEKFPAGGSSRTEGFQQGHKMSPRAPWQVQLAGSWGVTQPQVPAPPSARPPLPFRNVLGLVLCWITRTSPKPELWNGTGSSGTAPQ